MRLRTPGDPPDCVPVRRESRPIVRLQIAMDDSMPVCLGKRQSNLIQKVRDQRQRDLRMGLLEIRERLSVEQLHHEVSGGLLPGLRRTALHWKDQRVTRISQDWRSSPARDASGSSSNVARNLADAGSDHFDRNDASRAEMRCQVDIPHPRFHRHHNNRRIAEIMSRRRWPLGTRHAGHTPDRFI